jgi:hypothetical protein
MQDEFKEAKYNFGKSKIKDFIETLSVICTFKHRINTTMIPQGKYFFEYIQEIILYGSLATLLDLAILPTDGQNRAAIKESSDKMIITLMNTVLNKISKEDISYDDNKLKQLIEIQNEKERRVFASSLDKMSEEQRLIAILQRQIGVGDYAIGSKITEYDKQVWNVLQKQRKEMESGDSVFINDVPDFGEQNGIDIYADAGGYGDEGGYDVGQPQDDD